MLLINALKKIIPKKPTSLLGIDISNNSIKIIELSHKDNQFVIEGYGSEPLPALAMSNHSIKDNDAIATCIQDIIQKAQFKTNLAVFSVPDAEVITKIIQINEGLNSQEIEEFIQIEANKYIPYPINEINIDFYIIGPTLKNPAMQDLFIVASRSGNINNRIDIATKANLKIQAIDVESFAMERALQLLITQLPSGGEKKVIALIDVGQDYSNLYVLYDRKLIYTRENEFGIKQLIREIAHYYAMDESQALSMKIANNLPDNYHSEILMPYLDGLIMHIKRSLQFFFSNSPHRVTDQLLLAGNVYDIHELTALFQEKENILTTIVNPLSVLTCKKNINEEQINQAAPSMLIACGLALRKTTRRKASEDYDSY